MSDTLDKTYREIIHCVVLKNTTGAADVAILFNNQILLRMGLAETWVVAETLQKNER